MATSWENKGGIGFGLVMEDAVIEADTPATGIAMDVGALDFVSFGLELTYVAATSTEWWFEGSPDGTNWYRLPVNEDTSVPPDVTMDNGEFTWARAAGKDSWAHPAFRVTALKQIRIVVDSTAGTTDTMSVQAYAEAISSK